MKKIAIVATIALISLPPFIGLGQAQGGGPAEKKVQQSVAELRI